MTEDERQWLDNASRRGGSFVGTFAMACFAADEQNYTLLRPVLRQMMEKYGSYSIPSSAWGRADNPPGGAL